MSDNNKTDTAKNYINDATDKFGAFSSNDQATLCAGVIVILAAILPGLVGTFLGMVVGMVMIMTVITGTPFSKVMENMPWNKTSQKPAVSKK